MSLHTIAAILGVLVFLTIVGLYAWTVRRFGEKRSQESRAARSQALEDYRRTLSRREER